MEFNTTHCLRCVRDWRRGFEFGAGHGFSKPWPAALPPLVAPRRGAARAGRFKTRLWRDGFLRPRHFLFTLDGRRPAAEMQ